MTVVKTEDFLPRAAATKTVSVKKVHPIGALLTGPIYEVQTGRAILWPDGTHRGSGVDAERKGVPDVPYRVRGDDPFAFPRFAHNLSLAEDQALQPDPIPVRWLRELQERQGVLGDVRTDREKASDAVAGVVDGQAIQDPDEIEEEKDRISFELDAEVADVDSKLTDQSDEEAAEVDELVSEIPDLDNEEDEEDLPSD